MWKKKRKNKDISSKDGKLTLVQHLEELRRRFIICLLWVLVGSVVSWFYREEILSILKRPLGSPLVFLAPQEAFITMLKLAIFGGILLSLPVTLYQVWGFVSSALTQIEKKNLLLYGPLSLLSFIVGALFCYLVILPIGLKFLLSFGGASLTPMLSIDRYISFVIVLLLAFGVVFELPLASLFLTRLGLICPDSLRRRRKQAILMVFIISAILTPPDVLTQLFMAGPLLVLYEISIWLSKLAYRRQLLSG